MIRSLLFLFIVIVALRSAHCQVSTPQVLAQEIVIAIRTLDDKRFTKLLFDASDLGDQSCAFACAAKIREYREAGVKDFAKTYNDLFNIGLPLNELKVEGIKVVQHESMRLYVHISLLDRHGILLIPFLETNNGLRILHRLELENSPQSGLKKHFNRDEKVFLRSNIHKDHWAFMNGDPKRVKHHPSQNDSEETYHYFAKDTLQAIARGMAETGDLYLTTYYKNGRLRDSAYYQTNDKAKYQQALNDTVIWRMVTFWTGWSSKFVYRYWPDGKCRESSLLIGDTLIEQSFFRTGTLQKENKSVQKKTVSVKQYDIFGNQETLQIFNGKARAITLEDVETFPSFESVFSAYYDTPYKRDRVWFHRKPDGWYVQLRTTGEQFLHWSFQEQAYVKLPANPFTLYRPTNPRFERMALSLYENRSRESLFSGYSDATVESIALLEKGNALTLDQQSQLQHAYYELLQIKIHSTPFKEETEFRSLLGKFHATSAALDKGNIQQRASDYRRLASLFLAVTAASNQTTAAELIQFHKPDDTGEASIKVLLNDCEPNSILIADFEARLLFYQDKNNFRKDVTVIGIAELTEQWYRNYVERKLTGGKARIFNLSPSYYKRDSVPMSIDYSAPPLNLKDLLAKIKQPSTALSIPTKLKLSEVVPGKPVYYNFIPGSSIAELELIYYLATSQKRNVFGHMLQFEVEGEMTKGVVASKVNLVKAPQKGALFSPTFLVRLKDPLNHALPDHLLPIALNNAAEFVKANNNAAGKEAYALYVTLYNRNLTSEAYSKALEMVRYGLSRDYQASAFQLLDKAVLDPRDFCVQSDFYEDNNLDIEKLHKEMKQFFTEKGFKGATEKYAKYFDLK